MILTDETKKNYTGAGYFPKLSGRTYIGDYVNGKEHGNGMYQNRPAENIYTHRYAGEFVDNKCNGIGIKEYDQNEVYCGKFKDDQRHGLGMWKLGTGTTYICNFTKSKPNGHGMMITWDSLKYVGKLSGFNSTSNGFWYDKEGNEIDILELGYDKHGNRYIGSLNDQNEKHGTGTMFYCSGAVYKGEWEFDLRHGYGIWKDADCTVYEGQFKHNKRHGKGIWYINQGMIYKGEFKHNRQDGEGEISYPDGRICKGQFIDGKHVGEAVMIKKNNKKQGMLFDNGVVVKTWDIK